ncbi:FXSXX-COOH protein [Micromonospora avicenniae]|uniref:FXSXX-COOH protein n=1 Tax=Micromonospora avicenniae TaxID=1198245 RepID=A0A1N7AZR5_9ACTN|nr:FXSXX-COOH protein [Micromonospora avicenniae]
MDQTAPRHSPPSIDVLTRSLRTPLGRVATEHPEVLALVRRRVLPGEGTPPGTVPVAAFNSSI